MAVGTMQDHIIGLRTKVHWLIVASVVGIVLGTAGIAIGLVSLSGNPESVAAAEPAAEVASAPVYPGCTDGTGHFTLRAVDQFQVMSSDGEVSGPFDVLGTTARFWPAQGGVFEVRARNRLQDGSWGAWSLWQHCAALPSR